MQQHISFAGAGRVAAALCRKMYDSGIKIDLIVSQNEKPGRELADSCMTYWSSELLFPDSTDIIIVAVPDNRLEMVLTKIKCKPSTLIAHTAGSMGLDVFPDYCKHYGIFYPLQTFSRERKVHFMNLPFFIEASDNQSSDMLGSLAEIIGGRVFYADSKQRMHLHVAAVFVCNFTNHLMTIGKDITLNAGLDFEVLAPLLTETISKSLETGPENSQTGPAVRNDFNTIEKHLELLSFSPELQKIYMDMTNSIIKYYKKL